VALNCAGRSYSRQKALRRAGEDGLGMCAIAAQVVREAHDAIEIGARRVILSPVVTLGTLAFQFAQSFARQILGEDGFLLVGFVARSRRLKIEAQSAVPLIFKLR